jgi:hypothetical protein
MLPFDETSVLSSKFILNFLMKTICWTLETNLEKNETNCSLTHT